MAPRDTYKYIIVLNGRDVYAGITNDLQRRLQEHRQKPGWENARIRQVGDITTREEALAWEAEQRARGRRTGY